MDRRMFLALATATAASSAGAEVSVGRVVHYESMTSRYVDPRQVSVWLPPGYNADRGRYGVLYMHDGQNLFDPATAPFGEWGVDEVLSDMIQRGEVPPTIVVGVWNTAKRTREYAPSDLVARLPAAAAARARARAEGPLESDGYLRFLVEELKPLIDARYRTRPGREATAVMGSSMGGLISLYAGVTYPDVFGRVGCLSTHWPLLLGDRAELLEPTWFEAVTRAMTDFLDHALPPAGPRASRWYFDWGTIGLDEAYAPYQAVADAAFARKGYVQGRDVLTRGFPGAAHNEPSWRARLPIPMKFLLAPVGAR